MKKKILMFLMSFLILSCNNSINEKIEGNKIIKASDGYYLEYDNVYIKLKNETYITKERKFEDYFKKGILSIKDNNLITDLKKYFPHGFKGIVNGEIPEKYIEIPIINIGNKNIIDAINLEKSLTNINIEALVEKDETVSNEKEQANKEVVDLKGKNIGILNANGINGSAKRFGEALANTLGVNFKAENYNKPTTSNYIVNHKLSDNELEELASKIDLKNIKILEDATLLPDTDAVIILGKDNGTKINVEIVSKEEEGDLNLLLKEYNLSNLKESTYDIKDITSKYAIIYPKEYKLIAKNIKTIVFESELKENNELKDKIIIIRK